MKKLRITTVVGTRPEIIRMSEIIKKFDTFFEHRLIHTGQNPDPLLKDIFYRFDLEKYNPNQEINQETSLGFVGKNYTGYAKTFGENFLHLLENFAKSTPYLRITA